VGSCLARKAAPKSLPPSDFRHEWMFTACQLCKACSYQVCERADQSRTERELDALIALFMVQMQYIALSQSSNEAPLKAVRRRTTFPGEIPTTTRCRCVGVATFMEGSKTQPAS
jgi:hypothetical protein